MPDAKRRVSCKRTGLPGQTLPKLELFFRLKKALSLTPMTDPIYTYRQLQDFTLQIFDKIGCPPAEATLATEVLLNADLRGIDSHGIARLSGYVRLWEAKRVNATPAVRIV